MVTALSLFRMSGYKLTSCLGYNELDELSGSGVLYAALFVLEMYWGLFSPMSVSAMIFRVSFMLELVFVIHTSTLVMLMPELITGRFFKAES